MDVGKGREPDAEALVLSFCLVPALAGIPATTSDRPFPLNFYPHMTNLICKINSHHTPPPNPWAGGIGGRGRSGRDGACFAVKVYWQLACAVCFCKINDNKVLTRNTRIIGLWYFQHTGNFQNGIRHSQQTPACERKRVSLDWPQGSFGV